MVWSQGGYGVKFRDDPYPAPQAQDLDRHRTPQPHNPTTLVLQRRFYRIWTSYRRKQPPGGADGAASTRQRGRMTHFRDEETGAVCVTISPLLYVYLSHGLNRRCNISRRALSAAGSAVCCRSLGSLCCTGCFTWFRGGQIRVLDAEDSSDWESVERTRRHAARTISRAHPRSSAS